jgi:hypothetical protein
LRKKRKEKFNCVRHNLKLDIIPSYFSRDIYNLWVSNIRQFNKILIFSEPEAWSELVERCCRRLINFPSRLCATATIQFLVSSRMCRLGLGSSINAAHLIGHITKHEKRFFFVFSPSLLRTHFVFPSSSPCVWDGGDSEPGKIFSCAPFRIGIERKKKHV